MSDAWELLLAYTVAVKYERLFLLKYVRGITKADRDECHVLCRNRKARATLRPLSSTVICKKY
jgi:hypothetical protein